MAKLVKPATTPATAAATPEMQRLHQERIVIEKVQPSVDAGRFPVKREVGDRLEVRATIFRDGHDSLAALLKIRRWDDAAWTEVPMTCINPGLDLWSASVLLKEIGSYRYTVEAWTDQFATWRTELARKSTAGLDVRVELLEGLQLLADAADRAANTDADELWRAAAAIKSAGSQTRAVECALDPGLQVLVARYADRSRSAHFDRELEVVVDRCAARFAAWYEMFPRSQSPDPGRPGTFRDCIGRLADIADMGFDVVYFPPIHPVGRTHRKGKNNALAAQPDDPGSPWAIGSEHGGHKSIEPSLGSMQDFLALVEAARRFGIEIALDFAIQCSPDHPYVRQHPQWFHRRPDGSIKFAENPPKKYQDIYPLNFDTDDWPALWQEMKSIVLFWIERGIKTFRVDNPHTKPLYFWEWLIREVKQEHPEVIFLSEAFTRPPMMKALAKVGFSQSYTYFTWRNTKQELTDYLRELTQTELAEYFRGNLFTNTPDILHEYLQTGGRPAFRVRLLLAATLSSLYGIYSGFELCENVAVRPGSEEYLDSEKYQLRHRDWNAPGNIKADIALINRTRRQNPALQEYDNLRFHPTTDAQILCYSKSTPNYDNSVIIVVNLDPRQPHECFVELEMDALGLNADQPYEVVDQYSGAAWRWRGSRNYVRLDPTVHPGHLLVVRK